MSMEILKMTKPHDQVEKTEFSGQAPEMIDAHRMVLFQNFSEQPFSAFPYEWTSIKGEKEVMVDENCKWNGQKYNFPPGHQQWMELYMAFHFASHLINRELDKKGIATDNVKERQKLFPLAIADFGDTASEQDMSAAIFMKNLDLQKQGHIQMERKPVISAAPSNFGQPANSYQKMVLDQQRLIEKMSKKILELESQLSAKPAQAAKKIKPQEVQSFEGNKIPKMSDETPTTPETPAAPESTPETPATEGEQAA